ncbi:site-2 protease family protein [Legionella waltersii]|uniref:Transmembrane protein n=1 Tax=Legionella waltersii TaxID=66969 RepID=A0A0W1ANL0_9GAMM|nr:site-2 protease family protein [Legionella waltersii]KTD82908.1 transmembrane protein [Legionella waltersii]SNV02214.1 transmembrane protein [Legionella waltersii]
MPEFTWVQQICIWALPILLAITFHELAHGYVAYLFGDNTAKMFGRLTINPLKHIDPIGTVAIPLFIGILTNFNFVIGYAKPVPVNQSYLRNPRRDMILVTLAGPASNLIMAFLWAACMKVAILMNPQNSMLALFLLFSARAGIMINLILAFLNLIPLPPLDGSKVVMNMLPVRQAIAYAKIEPYGFFILIILIFTNILNYILTPLINGGLSVLSAIFNL